jgi:hypothetical protein
MRGHRRADRIPLDADTRSHCTLAEIGFFSCRHYFRPVGPPRYYRAQDRPKDLLLKRYDDGRDLNSVGIVVTWSNHTMTVFELKPNRAEWLF